MSQDKFHDKSKSHNVSHDVLAEVRSPELTQRGGASQSSCIRAILMGRQNTM